jgi:hypothetical protein
MKRMIVLMTVLGLLSGCGAAETYELVTDEPVQQVSAQPREMHFFLAEETAMPAMETDSGKLYLCGEYDVMSQIFDGGDLERTIRQVSGFSPNDLTVIQTESENVKKTEFVWTSAAEEGHRICRATILDDGNYHYVLSATVPAEKIEEYQEIWNGIFETFKLI